MKVPFRRQKPAGRQRHCQKENRDLIHQSPQAGASCLMDFALWLQANRFVSPGCVFLCLIVHHKSSTKVHLGRNTQHSRQQAGWRLCVGLDLCPGSLLWCTPHSTAQAQWHVWSIFVLGLLSVNLTGALCVDEGFQFCFYGILVCMNMSVCSCAYMIFVLFLLLFVFLFAFFSILVCLFLF